MSVMHCGDVGCPCRNLPLAVDDTAALRAEVERLRAVVGRVRALPHEAWCCNGCAGTEMDCRCLVATVRAALDEGAAT